MMKRCLCALLYCGMILMASSASAQDAEEPPPPDQAEVSDAEASGEDDVPPPPDADDAAAEIDDRDADAWRLLERAMSSLAYRDEEAARRYLEKLHDRYPEHPAAAASADALETLGGERRDGFLGTSGESPQKEGTLNGEDKSGIARAELAIFQTINGLAIGAELCGVARCEDPRLVIGSLAGGAGLGLGLSLYATRDGITPGHALAMNSGTFWGFANGLFLDLSLEPPDSFDNRRLPGFMAAGQVLGVGVGHLAYTRFQPDAGDVALMNTTGFWSGVIMMLINGIVEPEEPTAFARSTLAAFDLGLIGGALLSKHYPMSRGRAFVIDAGGLVGSLTGVGAYLFFTGGEGESRGGFTSAIIGAGAGLGLSTFLTRNWDEEDELFGDMHMMLAPAQEGRGGVVNIGGRF